MSGRKSTLRISDCNSALWTHAHPLAAMLAAYDADPALAEQRLDFTTTLRDLLAVLVSGLLARHGD